MRLEITRKAELAVRAMVVLGSTDTRLKGPALAEELQTTPAFVAQVVGPLVKSGWVRSEPGPTGGYVCRVGLDDVSVLEVIEAVDGPTDVGRCVVADRPCDSDVQCALHVAWACARQELVGVLAATSLSRVPAGVATNAP